MFKTLKPKHQELPQPFKIRRLELERDKRERDQFFVNRALDQAEGFSWSQGQKPRTLLERWRAVPLVNKLAALGALGIALAMILSFVSISRVGIEPKERLIYVESWSANRTAEDAIREREAEVARVRAEEAAFQARVKAAQDAQAARAAQAQAAKAP
jgi:hypothetical protein